MLCIQQRRLRLSVYLLLQILLNPLTMIDLLYIA